MESLFVAGFESQGENNRVFVAGCERQRGNNSLCLLQVVRAKERIDMELLNQQKTQEEKFRRSSGGTSS